MCTVPAYSPRMPYVPSWAGFRHTRCSSLVFVWNWHFLMMFSQDPDMFWDFITLRPETTHQVSFLFTGRGTPYGFRHMNGYSSHTFKMVNADGEAVYCKFHNKVSSVVSLLKVQIHRWWLVGLIVFYYYQLEMFCAQIMLQSYAYCSWAVTVLVIIFTQIFIFTPRLAGKYYERPMAAYPCVRACVRSSTFSFALAYILMRCTGTRMYGRLLG